MEGIIAAQYWMSLSLRGRYSVQINMNPILARNSDRLDKLHGAQVRLLHHKCNSEYN